MYPAPIETWKTSPKIFYWLLVVAVLALWLMPIALLINTAVKNDTQISAEQGARFSAPCTMSLQPNEDGIGDQQHIQHYACLVQIDWPKVRVLLLNRCQQCRSSVFGYPDFPSRHQMLQSLEHLQHQYALVLHCR